MKHIQLFESYKSQRELSELAKILLNFSADETIDSLQSYWSKIKQFKSVSLKNINPNIFYEIKQFIIEEGRLDIHIPYPENFHEYCNGIACYIKHEEDRLILIKEDEYTLKRVNDELEEWDKEDEQKIKDSVGDILNRYYHSHLLHELQHAYDDWRSKGKYTRGESDEYEMNRKKDKQLSNNLEELKEEEREFVAKHYKEYLNLPYEVDARFTQAVDKTNFYDWDLDKSFELEKDVFRMNSFEDVKKQFKTKMRDYNFLTEDEKKRVLRKLGQFYLLEKEFVHKLNKEAKSY